ncbi:hypothetical protein [Gottfriedia luciferensis]|uniref:hypothetical protein n=1 Tax=Gottfriedia luciferensis TaxID=178774 RepID=UPI00142E26D9|nr:hypothetical protein [Gottfriedia luciferensis]
MENYNPPKSVKKVIRFIHQDASKDQLIVIQKLLEYAINSRIKKLDSIKRMMG